jgi:hypothetical protein
MKIVRVYNTPDEITISDRTRIDDWLKRKPFLVQHDRINFVIAANAFNSSIPLTPWKSGKPPCVGEWNTKIEGYPSKFEERRWWNGKCWSFLYHYSDPECVKEKMRTHESEWPDSSIYWRGLAKEPIAVVLVR